MKFKVTQRYEESWICEVEAESTEAALRKIATEEVGFQRQPQSQTITVEQVNEQ